MGGQTTGRQDDQPRARVGTLGSFFGELKGGHIEGIEEGNPASDTLSGHRLKQAKFCRGQSLPIMKSKEKGIWCLVEWEED